jgi:hypothetical protein
MPKIEVTVSAGDEADDDDDGSKTPIGSVVDATDSVLVNRAATKQVTNSTAPHLLLLNSILLLLFYSIMDRNWSHGGFRSLKIGQ